MEKWEAKRYVRRTSKDYSLAFKMQVVEEVEKGEESYKNAQKKYGIQGNCTVLKWLRKHGRLDWEKRGAMGKTPQQEIRELKKALERTKTEKEVLEIAINIAEREFGIDIRKKYLAKLSGKLDNKGRELESKE